MQMLKKMFNSDGKYYLELDDVQEKEIDAATKANDAAKAKAEPAKEATQEATQKASKTAKKVTDSAPVQSEKTSATKTAKKTSPAETNGKTAPVATNAGTSSYEPPFWVAAMSSNNDSTSNGSNSNDSAEQTFATDNLMPTITKFRRSPGPSLNQFRDMAKNVRIRRR